jgi:predicted dehydrogenase
VSDKLRMAAIGLDHNHIFGITHALQEAGAELVAYVKQDHGLARVYGEYYADARGVEDARAVLEDDSIELVLSAAVPSERAAIGEAAMRHGKDFLSDKPGFTSAEALERARATARETGRRYFICFSERFESRATTRASALVRKGAIGRVTHTLGLGPHLLRAEKRPAWHFKRATNGGILTDIGSHQIDQFMHFAGATEASISFARVANRAHPGYPEFDDLGELAIESENASGYVRVDWFTPEGLGVWGDVRLFVQGTEGYLELRKNVDMAGRPGGDHLFLVDGKEVRHLDCSEEPLPFGGQLVADVRDRSETSMTQEHAFTVSALALEAQRLGMEGA